MDGRENDFESRGEKRHCILFNACAGSEEIGLTMKVSADRLFVYRRCHNGVDMAGESIGARGIQVSKRASARFRLKFPPLDRRGISP